MNPPAPWPCAFLFCCSLMILAQDIPVQYQQPTASHRDGPAAIARQADDVAPNQTVATRYQQRFTYSVQLTPHLSLVYTAERPDSPLGRDWHLHLRWGANPDQWLDLTAPTIDLNHEAEQTYLYHRDRVAAATATGADWTADFGAYRLRVSYFGTRGIRPVRLTTGQTTFTFSYDLIADQIHLTGITAGTEAVSLHYRHRAQILLEHITHFGNPFQTWHFEHNQAAQLTRLTSRGKNGVRQLCFGYQSLPTPDARLQRFQRGMWQRQTAAENGGRWLLPDGLHIAADPGLRFIHLDNSGNRVIDLVDVAEGQPKAWLGHRQRGFQPYPAFQIPQPHLRYQQGSPIPSGSMFHGLARFYGKGDARNTNAFQTLIQSVYRADQQGRITYDHRILFPSVNQRTGKIVANPQGQIWNRESETILNLPVPLQFENTGTWPDGAALATEHSLNQGARLINLEGRTCLFYSGLYYQSHDGHPVPQAPHRQRYTQNCQPRYDLTLRDGKRERRITVMLCQAVWLAAEETFEADRYDLLNPFWVRKDINFLSGRPNGKYALPWHDGDPASDDRHYRYHLEGLRNLRFARISRRGNHALIAGQARGSGFPQQLRASRARILWRLSRRSHKWSQTPATQTLPAAFFENPRAYLADLDNDGLDDLILPQRDGVHVQLNRPELSATGTIWWPAPNYRLPDDCLNPANCKLVDLDNDGDLDLFTGDGQIIYLNRATTADRGQMTSITDEQGERRRVP